MSLGVGNIDQKLKLLKILKFRKSVTFIDVLPFLINIVQSYNYFLVLSLTCGGGELSRRNIQEYFLSNAISMISTACWLLYIFLNFFCLMFNISGGAAFEKISIQAFLCQLEGRARSSGKRTSKQVRVRGSYSLVLDVSLHFRGCCLWNNFNSSIPWPATGRCT